MQVFQNLLLNAIKFHGQEPPKIHISVQKKENEWIFAVSDNGIGIIQNIKNKFSKYSKDYTTTGMNTPESGIGLSITQKIILHHGGRIWVESELGKGSTFYFTIPIKTEEYTNYF